MSRVLPCTEKLKCPQINPITHLAGLSPANLEKVGDGPKRHSTQNLVFTVLKGKLLFIVLLIHGGRGVRCEQARVATWRGTGITSPGEGGDAAPCLPQTPPWTPGETQRAATPR